jgi:hypothetical protein
MLLKSWTKADSGQAGQDKTDVAEHVLGHLGFSS